MPGERPNLHIKTRTGDETLSELAIGWQKNATFFSAATKVDIPAGTNIMVFIHKPKEPEKGKRKAKQAATAEA